MKTLLQHSQMAVDSRECQYLEIRPTDELFGEASEEIGLHPIGHYFHHVINLAPSIDELFHRIR